MLLGCRELKTSEKSSSAGAKCATFSRALSHHFPCRARLLISGSLHVCPEKSGVLAKNRRGMCSVGVVLENGRHLSEKYTYLHTPIHASAQPAAHAHIMSSLSTPCIDVVLLHVSCPLVDLLAFAPFPPLFFLNILHLPLFLLSCALPPLECSCVYMLECVRAHVIPLLGASVSSSASGEVVGAKIKSYIFMCISVTIHLCA